jgi:DNA-binding winged helix-turn-helix (wHTH) protein
VIRTGPLAVNLDRRSASFEGHQLCLTGKEYGVLELLSLRKGVTLTKEMILDHLYGGIEEPEPKVIETYVYKLRKKIAHATAGPHYIETVPGIGYVLKDPVGEAAQRHREQRIETSSREERDLSDRADEAIGLIETLLKRSLPANVLPGDRIDLFNIMRLQIMLIKVIEDSPSTYKDEVLGLQLSILNQYAIALQHNLQAAIERLRSVQSQELEEATVVEGNVVRTSRSGTYKTGKRWVAEQEFQSDSFRIVADFAKCMYHSKTLRQKSLCNIAFIIELLRALTGVASQLVPFATRK